MNSYKESNNCTYITDDGETEMIANFVAEITTETKYTDGMTSNTVLTLNGTSHDGTSFPEIDITAEKFAAMTWPLTHWGTTAILTPGQGAKEDLRHAIQLKSKPKKETVYQHTGWSTDGGSPMYLHQGGAIRATGNDPTVRVEMPPPKLSRYKLTQAETPEAQVAAVKATLALLRVAPIEVTWPMLAATLAPLFGGIDFGMHLAGRTGTRKSELCSLFQSHYGNMDARNLPCSWSSTPNALEAETYRTKDALVTIDDFVPNGTRYQIMQLNKTADQVFRGLGNQAGRSRLTDSSNLQNTMFPRGMVLSTGEDTPEGHSVRGRMLILEIAPGEVKLDKLSEAQRNRSLYPQTTAGFIRHIAANYESLASDREGTIPTYRDAYQGIGHGRTPTIIGNLLATVDEFLTWCYQIGAINNLQRGKGFKEAKDSIVSAGKKQEEYLTQVDPCQQFIQAVRTLLGSYLVHIDHKNGGIPRNAELLGYTTETSTGAMPVYKAHGKLIGWIDWEADILYLDAGIGYELIAAKAKIAFSKQTLMKRLKESALLVRINDAQQRNTIRVTLDGHPRTVLAMSASEILETKEKPTDA